MPHVGHDRLTAYKRRRKLNWIVNRPKISKAEITAKAGIEGGLPTATIEGKVELKPTKKRQK